MRQFEVLSVLCKSFHVVPICPLFLMPFQLICLLINTFLFICPITSVCPMKSVVFQFDLNVAVSV